MKKWILAILTVVMLCGACAQADYLAGKAAEDAGLIELAFELWEEAAAQGDAQAANALGGRYYNGTYGEVDYAKAMEYFMAAAELGYHKSMRNIALMYKDGKGVEQDIEKALEWHMKAAALGNGLSMNNIGIIYRDRGDYAAAMEWHQKALASGYEDLDGAPCTNIGQLYHEGWGVEQDYEKAMEWYLRGVQEGSAVSAYNIGIMYRDGDGVEQDYAMAAQWLEKCLELDPDYLDALNWLGIICRQNGYGMTPDAEKSYMYFERAAGLGSAVSAYNIGKMYYYGDGVEKDYAASAQWVEKAVELDPNFTDALNWLGMLYLENGYGMTQDAEKAYLYFERAAGLGSAAAAYNIGLMYSNSMGLETDYAMAAQWWEKSVALDPDYLDAVNGLGWVYQQNEYGMTPDPEKAAMYIQRAYELGGYYVGG